LGFRERSHRSIYRYTKLICYCITKSFFCLTIKIIFQIELKKWQEKHDSALKDLQSKESSFQRMEMELERTRHELERAKMASDKAESSKQLQQVIWGYGMEHLLKGNAQYG
jgi:hypothetical protein